jgi:hypothetical protein
VPLTDAAAWNLSEKIRVLYTRSLPFISTIALIHSHLEEIIVLNKMSIRTCALFAACAIGVGGTDAFVFHSKTQTTPKSSPASFPSLLTTFSSDFSRAKSSPSKLFSANEDASEDVAPLESIELTDEKIAEMMELTFVKSCLQLATGYVDVLKLFLASTIAAYDREISIPQLIKSLADCPGNTANRPLSKEEIDLRSSWIMISYLTLETMNRLEKKEIIDMSVLDDIRESYGHIVEQMVKKSLGLADGDLEGDATPSDPQAAAIFAYNLKVIELTISNIEDAKFANEATPTIDEDGVGPPRPKIPGAY